MSQQTINTPRDTTLQATNTALGLIAKDASLLATNTALGLLAKDDTLDDVVTNLSTIITKLQAIATALTPSIANDYDELVDKPQINGVTLSGNKTAKQLGIRQTIPMNSAAYALLSSAEKMDPDKDYIITDANAVNVPIDDSDISVNKVWSSKKTDDTKADKEAILQTVEECEASTDPDDIAGAAAVSALKSKLNWTLLWTAPDHNDVSAYDIQLPSNNFEYYILHVVLTWNTPIISQYVVIPREGAADSSFITGTQGAVAGTVFIGKRRYTASGNNITSTAGASAQFSSSPTTWVTSNSRCLLAHVYGVHR